MAPAGAIDALYRCCGQDGHAASVRGRGATAKGAGVSNPGALTPTLSQGRGSQTTLTPVNLAQAGVQGGPVAKAAVL